MATTIVCVVTFGAKVIVPVWPVKSPPATAVPFAVAKSTVTGWPETGESVTVKVIVPAASLTVTSLIESDGGPSLSMMPATALAGAKAAPLTGVALSVKDSVASWRASSVVGRRNCTLVVPAGIVTLPATGSQVVPSVETSSAGSAPVSVPTAAVPDTSAGVNTTGAVLGFESVTVKTAAVPSTASTVVTASVGRSLSLPPGPVPSSRMVPTPVPSAIVALVGWLSTTLKTSLRS